MKAIVQDRYGSTDVLEFRDIEEPVVGENDVLVRVHAAGCGPDVWHMMTGKPYFARLFLGLGKPKVPVRGRDVAATVPISGLTALQAFRDEAKVQPVQSVLVIGAAGGVGTLTVQIAKAFGAEVTGVSSTSKMDLVRSVGADEVIDYTRQDFTDGSRRWDLIIDTAGRRPLSRLPPAVAPKGTLVIVGGDGGGRWTGGFFRGVLRAPLLSVFVGQRLVGLATKERKEDLLALAELIEAGKVTPVIDRTYPLIEAPEAIRYMERGHPRGKVVITV